MIYEDFRALPFLRELHPDDLPDLYRRFKLETFGPEEMVFKQGARAKKLYLLLKGQVRVIFKPEDGERLLVATIEPGEIFGWSAALARERYTSGAVCTRGSQVLSITGRDLHTFCVTHVESGVHMLEGLARVIAARVGRMERLIAELLQESLVHNGWPGG